MERQLFYGHPVHSVCVLYCVCTLLSVCTPQYEHILGEPVSVIVDTLSAHGVSDIFLSSTVARIVPRRTLLVYTRIRSCCEH